MAPAWWTNKVHWGFFSCFVFYFLFFETESYHVTSCLGTCCVDQAGLQLTKSLCSLICWDLKPTMPGYVRVFYRILDDTDCRITEELQLAWFTTLKTCITRVPSHNMQSATALTNSILSSSDFLLLAQPQKGALGVSEVSWISWILKSVFWISWICAFPLGGTVSIWRKQPHKKKQHITTDWLWIQIRGTRQDVQNEQ